MIRSRRGAKSSALKTYVNPQTSSAIARHAAPAPQALASADGFRAFVIVRCGAARWLIGGGINWYANSIPLTVGSERSVANSPRSLSRYLRYDLAARVGPAVRASPRSRKNRCFRRLRHMWGARVQ